MKILTAVLALELMTAVASAQDPAALIEKLKSKDKDEAENARVDLLKAGAAALQPLRDAAGKASEADVKKLLTGLADRLETRKAAAGLAKAWGDKWYAITINGLHVGYAHLKTEEKDDRLVFTDEFHFLLGKNNAATIHVGLTCAPDEYLSFSELSIKSETPDRNFSATGRVKEGRLIVKNDEKVNAMKLDPKTVPDVSFFRLVTLLPRIEEYDLSIFQLVGGNKPQFHENSTVKFEKEETIEFEGKKVKTRRYMLAHAETEARFFFVDAEGRLLRVQFQSDDKGVDFTLSDEKRARDLDTKD